MSVMRMSVTLLSWIRNLKHTRLASHHQEQDPPLQNAEEGTISGN